MIRFFNSVFSKIHFFCFHIRVYCSICKRNLNEGIFEELPKDDVYTVQCTAVSGRNENKISDA